MTDHWGLTHQLLEGGGVFWAGGDEAHRGLGTKMDGPGQQDSTSRGSECLGREGGQRVGLGRGRQGGAGIWAPESKLKRPQIPPQPETA